MEQLVKTNEYRFRWIGDVRFSVCSLQLFNSSKGSLQNIDTNLKRHTYYLHLII